MPGTISKRAFTADEFQKLDQLNFFGPEERLELIDGEIRAMPPWSATWSPFSTKYWTKTGLCVARPPFRSPGIRCPNPMFAW